MFSTGSGSHDGSSYPTHWALTPAAYQNSDQVDWAALAQQWIMMKEAAVLEMPVGQGAPPATPVETTTHKAKEPPDEGGEAPMDVENEKEDGDWNNLSSGGSGGDWNWQQNWGWNSNWNGGPSGVPPPTASVPTNSTNKSALLPTPYSQFTSSNVENNSNVDFNNSTAPLNEFNSNYWTNNSGGTRGKGGPGKTRPSRKGAPPPTENRIETTPTTTDTTVTLDASKRRQLPAWIREGLEKMEREKQKQMEREREKAEREEYLTRKKEETEGAIKILQATGLPEKSKFDSDSEESSSGRVIDQSERTTSSNKRNASPVQSPPTIAMTEEEKIHQKMVMVRRAMTEVLLKVTNTEIMKICQEEIFRNRQSNNAASAKKVAQSGTPGQGSVAAPLAGLGVYGGDSDSSADDSEKEHHHKEDSHSKYKKMHLEDSIKILKDGNNRRRRFSQRNERGGDKSDEPIGTPDRNDNGERDHSQVDTAQSHGSGSLKSRRRSRSQNSSSRTPPQTTRKDKDKQSPDTSNTKHYNHKKTNSKRSSSSSNNSESEDSSSNTSSSSSSSRETSSNRRKHRDRSLSSDLERSRKRIRRSRSSEKNSSDSRSDDRSHSRSYSSRRSDRSKRGNRSRSRSRRRSRSRDRNHRHRDRSRDRDRSVSRDRSYRSRSRTRDRQAHRSRSRDRRSHSRSRSRRRRSTSFQRGQRNSRYTSPSGGKRSRR